MRLSILLPFTCVCLFHSGMIVAQSEIAPASLSPEEASRIVEVVDRMPQALFDASRDLTTADKVKTFREIAVVAHMHVRAMGLFRVSGSANVSEFGNFLLRTNSWVANNVSAKKPAPQTSHFVAFDLMFDTLEAYSDKNIAVDPILGSWLSSGAEWLAKAFDQAEASKVEQRESIKISKPVALVHADIEPLTAILAFGVVTFPSTIAKGWRTDPDKFLPQVEASSWIVSLLHQELFKNELEKMSHVAQIAKTALLAVNDPQFNSQVETLTKAVELTTETGEDKWEFRNQKSFEKNLARTRGAIEKYAAAPAPKVLEPAGACATSYAQ